MFIGSFASLILLLWMIGKLWKQSALLAIAALFLWPVLIYALFKYWGDEESDIKLPFALFVVAFGYMWYDMYTQLKTETPEPEALLALVRLFA